MLNLSWWAGVEQEAKLEVNEDGKNNKGWEWGEMTSQSPRGAKLAPSRGEASHKGWEREWDDKPSSQIGAGGGSLIWSCETKGGTQNWIAPPCWGRSQPDKVAAVGQCSCCLFKTTALNTLLKLAVSYLRPQLQPALWTEGTKYYSQADYLVWPHQSSSF
jgi:hypothetical protein